MNDFQNEWAIVHNDIERYERFSLIIKLFSVLICTLSFAFSINSLITIIIILILWLQDGIWKTFQKRLGTRILFIEQQLTGEAETNNTAFQLYSEWQKNRSGTIHLVKEYLLNSLKPTIAYPYILLVSLFFLKV